MFTRDERVDLLNMNMARYVDAPEGFNREFQEVERFVGPAR